MSAGLLAGIGLTHLRVYEQRPAPDGTMSGCAHVHALTDEAYYVIAGTGALELHDVENGYRSVPLAKGDFVQFPPNTLHRSVSTGGLEVLAIMGNAGLAERGDARIYFGPGIDDDPREFARLVALPATRGLEGALERRDLSAIAYCRLLDLWRLDRDAYWAELSRFTSRHQQAIAARRAEFAAIVHEGPERWLRVVQDRLGAAFQTMATPSVTARQDASPAKFGMCGILGQLDGLARV
jgi:mannose-6-phosphate isomerase-like protein (cupin superfamily)